MLESLEMFFFQLLIVVVLISVLLFLIKFNISLVMEKRISKYSIDSIMENRVSLADNIYNIYQKMVRLLSVFLLKFKIFNNYSLKYSKYIDFFDKNSKIATDYIANKILIGFIFVLLKAMTDIIAFRHTYVYEIIIIGLIGFFIPDVWLKYSNYLKRKKIENDMYNAIIIMNNAFKSGRSTMQAIDIVKNELEGPIKEEFKKIYMELSYGIPLEIAFKRFSERIDLEEVAYITSSLTILNRTGGNIVKVFSSIERSLLDKKKLQLELKSLTSNSRAMIKSLVFLPFIFSSIIIILNPTYFYSLIETSLGLVILSIIVFFYIIYVYSVHKILKVRM